MIKTPCTQTSRCYSHLVTLGVTLATASLVDAATSYTTIPADQWGVMQVVPSGNSGGGPLAGLYYPFTGAALQPLSVTCQFGISGYAPGSYEAGYVAPGWISLDMGDGHTDGTAIFEIDKPYTAAWSEGYTEVLLGNDGRGVNVGTYSPGGLYTITFTFNRPAATIQIDVTGPTSCSRTVASNGRDIIRLNYHGGNYEAFGSCLFGNVSVVTAAPPTPPALVLEGILPLSGSNVMSLTWTNNGAACVLESSENLFTGWNPVSTPCSTNFNWVCTQVTNASAAHFFRLRGL